MSPEEQIQSELAQLEAFILNRITVDFPMFDDVQLGAYDADETTFQGLFSVALQVEESQRVPYLFTLEKGGRLTVTRA